MPRPFVFMTSIHAVQLTGLRASNLAELHAGLSGADDACVYHHTHRFLRTLHFLPDAPNSDFALWVGENLREDLLAERLASLDLRDFESMGELKAVLLSMLEKARQDDERWKRRVPPGLEFHFCRSTSLVLSTGREAAGLEDFIAGLGEVDAGCLYYHLVEAPLRRHEDEWRGNDFSEWLAKEMGLEEEARKMAELDPYLQDLEALRGKMLEVLRGGHLRAVVERVLARHAPSETGEVVRKLLQKWRSS